VLPLSQVTEDMVRVEAEGLAETRGRLLAVLRLLVAGDALAAEYLLLALLARVHTRQDSFILGNVSLNLTGLTCLQARNLSKFLSAVLPFVAHVPLTIETLETRRFAPRKNYDTNLLETGAL